MTKVLLTGAGGGVGRMIRPLLAARYALRVSDRVAIPHEAGEEHMPADLADIDAVRAAVRGVDAIVHLGGFSLESDFGTILAANIVGTRNLFEAARLEGVRRVVFASSNHVMGFYPRTEKIGVDRSVRPDSRYGVSKAFGEALASLYADKYGAECLVIRIGHIAPKPENPRDLAVWLSPRDFVQLIAIGIERPDLRYAIVYGMSDNARAWWEDSAARALGYRPEDRSEDYAAEVLAKGDALTGDPVVDLNQGGAFAAAEDMKPA
ncbi:MAG TPA: NAD(P)-dependent oxidoreductase [Bauldia sp.]|nr:NAD(P)-dependent oxidoreductase [Bauldia sp.]